MKVVQSDGTEEVQAGNLNLALGQIIAKGSDLLNQCSLEARPFQNRTFVSYINQMQTAGGRNYSFRYGKMGNEIDETTKGLYYLHENVYDGFTRVADGMMEALEREMEEYLKESETVSLVLISSVLCLTLVSTILIFHFVRKIEVARIESLSLYSEVYLDDINQVIEEIVAFVQIFKDDTIVVVARKMGVMGSDSDDEYQQLNPGKSSMLGGGLDMSQEYINGQMGNDDDLDLINEEAKEEPQNVD